MRRFASVTLALFAVVVAGCGGGGGGGVTVPSPFAGRWIGTWTNTLGAVGTADITIAANGAATGAIVNTTQGVTGTLAGTVINAGTMTGTCDYHDGHPASGSGTLAIGGNGHLGGAVAWHDGATDLGTSTFDLQPAVILFGVTGT